MLRAFENTPGAIVTIPHKIASVGYVDALSDRARLLGAVNMVRRLPGGRLEGDMSDGLGFLAAAAQQGVSAQGKSVAVFGGGAVGRAVLLACCEAGASRVAFHEPDGDRRAALQRLADSAGFADRVTLDAISTYPEADIAVNASPLGMRPDDPLPFAPDRLAPHAHVADVVTDPEISPLLAAARACGLTVQTGRAMAESQRDIQLAFFGLDQAGRTCMTASKHTAMPPDGRAFVSSFARGLKVIESFGPDNRSMTVAEVAERTGVDRAVARRLLLTLVHLGFVHVHERRFELTTHVLRLAYSFLSSAGLGASLQPFLDDLARDIKETVSISVLDEAEVVFVARSDIPGRRLAYVVTTGMRLPAFSSASGRMLLAHRPIADVKKLLARTRIVRLTRRTIVNQAEITKATAAARRDGHALNYEETEDDLIGITVPVFNRAGLVEQPSMPARAPRVPTKRGCKARSCRD